MSLIDEIRSGSNEAIKQLYQENAQDVYDFAKGITGNHDTAMQATKNTLSKLVQQIQNGSQPANLHSEALKLAYDEACKIAMPSIKNVKSPYDEETETVAQPRRAKKEQQAPRRKSEYIEEEYYADDEDEYEEEPVRKPAPRRRPQEREYDNRRRPQPQSRRRDDYYEDDYDDRYDDYEDEYDDYEDDYYDEKKKHGAGFVICLIINIILVLVLIWFLLGLLMNLGVVPDTFTKYGYEWFNSNIYPLF